MRAKVGAGSGVKGGGIFVWESLVGWGFWISTEGAQEMQKVALGYRLSAFRNSSGAVPSTWRSNRPSDLVEAGPNQLL